MSMAPARVPSRRYAASPGAPCCCAQARRPAPPTAAGDPATRGGGPARPWCGTHSVPPRTVPTALRAWLFDPSSLSRRLTRACPGGFRVLPLAQGWERPLPAERKVLALAPRERALVREVLLLCHDTPWVFARSVIPRRLLRGPGRRLAHLGTRPLGDLLFAMPGTRRDRVSVAPAAGDPRTLARCARALGHRPEGAWKRASVFRVRGRALLVSEIFLEGFVDA